MTALKGILAGFLSFLLLLSLSVFGIALMVNFTALNPDFITNQVDQVDFTELANDFVDENYIEEIPEDMRFFEDVVYEVIRDHEPWLKDQFSSAVHTGYDYMLGNTDTLEIRIPLEELKETVKESAWLHFMELLPEWITDTGDEGLRELIYDNVHEFVEDIPQDYLPDEYQSLSESQLQGYVDEYFDDIAAEIVDNRLPPSLETEIEDLLLPYFDRYYDEIVEEIPSELVVNESEIDDDVWEILEDIRHYIGIFKAVFYALIGFIVLLIGAIFLVYRSLKDSTRTVGITFLVYGVTEFVVVILARILVPNYVPFEDIPESMKDLILNVYSSVLAPLQWFSLGILIVGLALLVSSFFIKRNEPDDFYEDEYDTREVHPNVGNQGEDDTGEEDDDISEEDYEYTD
jgi:membrane-associated HD superfamily phosphohydrolase